MISLVVRFEAVMTQTQNTKLLLTTRLATISNTDAGFALW